MPENTFPVRWACGSWGVVGFAHHGLQSRSPLCLGISAKWPQLCMVVINNSDLRPAGKPILSQAASLLAPGIHAAIRETTMNKQSDPIIAIVGNTNDYSRRPSCR